MCKSLYFQLKEKASSWSLDKQCKHMIEYLSSINRMVISSPCYPLSTQPLPYQWRKWQHLKHTTGNIYVGFLKNYYRWLISPILLLWIVVATCISSNIIETLYNQTWLFTRSKHTKNTKTKLLLKILIFL